MKKRETVGPLLTTAQACLGLKGPGREPRALLTGRQEGGTKWPKGAIPSASQAAQSVSCWPSPSVHAGPCSVLPTLPLLTTNILPHPCTECLTLSHRPSLHHRTSYRLEHLCLAQPMPVSSLLSQRRHRQMGFEGL